MPIKDKIPNNYKDNKVWLTLDLEEFEDANFNLIKIANFKIDYNEIIDNWLLLCDKYNIKSTIFVLGSFAQKYPNIVKRIYQAGHEIASHGYEHHLVYNQTFEQWTESITLSKKILEDTISDEVKGYRSPSWSIPHDEKYYEQIAKTGYEYSSSYFPFKTYMYGHSTDKKNPFSMETKKGIVAEIPIPKMTLPFSGGFYLRVLPLTVLNYFFRKAIENNIKPVFYIHPYELLDTNLAKYFLDKIKINRDYFLATVATSKSYNKIDKILQNIKDVQSD